METTKQDVDGVVTVDSFLSERECRALIEMSESKGYGEAAINTGYGQKIVKDVRNNDRILFDDFDLAKTM